MQANGKILDKSESVYLEGESPARVKTYYKSELAGMYEVSVKTFSRWIHAYLEELEALGYKKTDKKLRPKIVRFLFEKLDSPY